MVPSEEPFKGTSLPVRLPQPVEVHAYADRIIIRQDGRIVAEHSRSFGRGETIYDPLHYMPVLARKPGHNYEDDDRKKYVEDQSNWRRKSTTAPVARTATQAVTTAENCHFLSLTRNGFCRCRRTNYAALR